MTQTIETPFGPYLPVVPSPDDLEQAGALMRDTVRDLAELNHDLWAAKRIAEGWRYGTRRDDEGMLHPCLVAYAHLPESEKAYDRDTARGVIAALLKRGLIRGG